MQVFITDFNLCLSAESLDDVRLIKQITEINQILLTYVNDGGGHANHPVNQWYKSYEGIDFLLDYLHELCQEYFYRHKKHHMGFFTYHGLCDFVIESIQYNNPDFKPAYIKGQKGKDQIITTKNVCERYKELLTNKWNNDIVKPKWTKRGKPDWYKEDEA